MMYFRFLAICFLLFVAVISSISDDPIKVYWPWDNSLCDKGPSRLLFPNGCYSYLVIMSTITPTLQSSVQHNFVLKSLINVVVHT